MIFPWENEQEFVNGGAATWPRNILIADGFDPFGYISTAQLQFYPYTTQVQIQAKIGGLIKLISACDDSYPPVGQIQGDALAVYNSTLQNVTNEINGYLSTVYPVPLQQTGTVAIFRVTGLSTDGNNSVTAITPIVGANGNCGNYAVAPSINQSPVYLRFLAPEANCEWWGPQWWNCQQGTGLELTVAYNQEPVTVGGGAIQNVFTVAGTPAIVSGGANYNCGDLVILTGGASFVPAKVQEAMLVLCCHDLWQRRLASDEKNIFKDQARKWRGVKDDDGLLQKIGHGEQELDGTFKRFYSAAASWNRSSVLQGPTT